MGPDPKQWDQIVDKAIGYLKTTQEDDGSWSRKKSLGVTGIVLTGLLRTGRVSAEDPVAAKALSFIESLINEKAGHIAGKDPAPQLQNYVTSVNLMALVAAKREDRYKKVIGDAKEFLKKLQWDESKGINPSDDRYGGAGYDSKSRPDLSNEQMWLDALKDAGIPPGDPALKKALIFVSRCQNRFLQKLVLQQGRLLDKDAVRNLPKAAYLEAQIVDEICLVARMQKAIQENPTLS